MPSVHRPKDRGVIGSILHAAGAGYNMALGADRRIRNYIVEDPKFDREGNPIPYTGLGGRSFITETAHMFDPRTREGKLNLLGMVMPGPKGGKPRPMTRAEMDAAARSGQLAGGAVTVKKMSPAQMAAAKAEREAKAGINTADMLRQHGAEGLFIKNGQKGVENLIAIAKHPGHSNTKHQHAVTDVWDRPMTPAMEKALMDGPEGTRSAFIVDQQGRITVGGPGAHHDQLMREQGVTDPHSVIQGELHHEQNIGGDIGKIPARIFTGRSIRLANMGGSMKLSDDLVSSMGPGVPNHLQTAALEDWLNKANGVGHYTPMSGKPTHPSPKVTIHKDPHEAADMARARNLRRKLAGEPNPLGKSSPSALQIAGRANPAARSEGARLAGFPDNRGRDHTTQRVRLGVEEGGMSRPSERPVERVLVPSKKTPLDKPRLIPGPGQLKKRPDRMH